MKKIPSILLWVTIALWLCTPTLIYAQRSGASYINQVYRGQKALREKRWNDAEANFRNALLWKKNGVEAHVGLGEAYLQLGQRQRAEEAFAIALRLKPHFKEAERGMREARTEAEAEAAFHVLEVQVKQEPNNADFHTSYAEELLVRGRTDEAKQEAETALHLKANEAHAYCALGRIAVRQGKDEEARTLLQTAIKRDNTDEDAFLTLGDLALKEKDYRKAVKDYRRVVSILPEQSEGHQKLMEAFIALGDTQGAEKEKKILDHLKQREPGKAQLR